jgi:hypothetical protein
MLNAKPEFSAETRYKVALQVNGLEIEEKDADSEWVGNPLTQNVSIDYKVWDDAPVDGDRDFDWESVRFVNTDLKQVDPQNGRFVFMNAEGNRVVLQKIRERQFHWDAF